MNSSQKHFQSFEDYISLLVNSFNETSLFVTYSAANYKTSHDSVHHGYTNKIVNFCFVFKKAQHLWFSQPGS